MLTVIAWAALFPGVVVRSVEPSPATTDHIVLRLFALDSGVLPTRVSPAASINTGREEIVARMLDLGLVCPRDATVLTGRADLAPGGATNHFLLHRPDAAAAGDVDVLRRDARQLQARTVEETVAGA